MPQDRLIPGSPEDWLVTSVVEEAEFLTSFAWEARYPGLGEPVTADEHEEALRRAQDVVTWAEKELSS